MNGRQLLHFVWALALPLIALTTHASVSEAPPPAVAVIESAASGVRIVPAGSDTPIPASAGMILTAASRILIVEGETAIVGLADGRRWRLSGSGIVVVAKDGLRTAGARAEALETVPALVRVVPVLADPLACATRIRNATNTRPSIELSPASRSQLVAGPLTLGFEPPPGYTRFRVKLVEAWDRTLLDTVTAQRRLEIPASILKPGSSYRWQVETLDRDRPVLREVAVFTTLGGEAAMARAELARRLSASDDTSLRELLTAFDGALCIDPEPSAGKQKRTSR